MGVLDIRVYPDSVLQKIAEEVSDINQSVRKAIYDMITTMFSSGGVGLAAPQVGINLRFAIIDPSMGQNKLPQKKGPMVIINPKIIYSEGEVVAEEGCLSFPETYAPIKRAERIEVEFYTFKGKAKKIVAEDFLARVLQHEIDHLDGILFIDRLSRLRRDFVKMRYLKKMKKKGSNH